MQQVFSTPKCMKKDFRFTYCPGCDHGVATRLVAELIDEFDLREKGVKVGCFRPITLSPFPEKRLRELAIEGKDFLVVEMNMGQMFKDVKCAVEGRSSVSLINRPCGEWLSVDEIVVSVLKEVRHAASV